MLAQIKAIQGNAATQVEYLEEDYGSYLGADLGSPEHSTYWLGGAAAILGLKGPVKKEPFTNLLRGLSPVGERLVHGFKDRVVKQPDGTEKLYRNVNSYDIPIALEKSFSILATTLTADERSKFNKCMKNAAKDVVYVLENLLQLGRRGKNGVDRIPIKVAASAFVHEKNRCGEVHTHTHFVLSNVGLGADGRWSKLDSKALHEATPLLGRVFRASFAREMIQTFGIDLEIPTDTSGKRLSSYAVKGIPRELCEALSTAREKLLAHAGEGAKGKGKEAARLRTEAHLETRDKKDTSLTASTLRRTVFDKAEKLGVDANAFRNALYQTELPNEDRIEEAYKQALDLAVNRLAEERAYFTRQDVAKEILDHVQTIGVGGAEICQRAFRDVALRPELERPQTIQADQALTSRSQFGLEKSLVAKVESLSERKGARVRNPISIELASFRHGLSAEQDRALDVAVRGDGSVRVITGVAGSGKSKLLKAVRELYEARGFSVTGCAVAGVVAKDLEAKTAIRTPTVASVLHAPQRSVKEQWIDEVKHDLRMVGRSLRKKKTWDIKQKDLSPRSVLIVEEAGMLSAKDLDAILEKVQKAKATVILVGDTEQLPAIGPGSPLEFVSSKIKTHAHLETNYRQLDEEDRKAVQAVREGRIEDAMISYKDRGKVIVSTDREKTQEALVDTWKQNGGIKNPSSHIILTQTRSDAARLNDLCQQSRIQSLKIPEHRSITIHQTRFVQGDRVMFHRSLRSLGVENGHTATVVRADPKRQELILKLERPLTNQQRASGLKRQITLKAADLSPGQLKLGYAATTHKLQGATVDNAYVMAGRSMTNKQMAYVQLSRARRETTIFVEDSLADNDLAELSQLMKRDRKNRLALEAGLTSPQSQSLEM